MLKHNPIVKRFADHFTQWVATLLVMLLAIFACVEQEKEIADEEIIARFDADYEDVKDIMTDQPDLAIEKLNVLINNAESSSSKYLAGKGKFIRGYIYDEILEDVNLAYRNYQEALKDVLSSDDSSLKMKIFNNLGILYRFYRQYDAAISNYESAILLKDDLSIEQLSNVYHNYGVALKLKGDSASFYKAEKAFTKSLEYAEQINNSENIASVHLQVGLMYKAIKDYEMARIAYNNIIDTYVGNSEMQEYVGKAFHGIGVTYKDQMMHQSAIDAFEKALNFKRSSGSIFITKYDLGTVLLRDKQLQRAINVWEDALTEKHNKNNIEQVQIYADLTAALSMNGQYEQALDYSDVYNINIQNILTEGEKYKSKSDQILFANIVKDYDEFSKPKPFYADPKIVLAMILALSALIYAIAMLYYRSKSKKKVTQVMSRLQTGFTELKID